VPWSHLRSHFCRHNRRNRDHPQWKQKRQRRQFTPEFKAEAVRIVRTSGKSVHAMARELGLTETCLRTLNTVRSVECSKLVGLHSNPDLHD